MAISLECIARTYYGTYEHKVREKSETNQLFKETTMLRRWRRMTSRRRAARLKFKQHPMTPSSSPVREVSDQEDYCPDSTMTTTEHNHPQRPDRDDEPQRKHIPADPVAVHNQATPAVTELEGLSLKINNFTRGENGVVEAGSDGEEKHDTDTIQAQPTSPLDDPEEGSQTSSEESWASSPSSGSSSLSTDNTGNSSTDEQDEKRDEGECTLADSGPLPSPETTFKFYKFHEEFKEFEAQEDEEDDDEEDEVNDDPRFSPTGPWASSAVPRWAFLRSSNSLPVLNLGPGDFYHGGSALRHEVSADEDDGDGYPGSRGSPGIAMVGVVHL